MDARPFQESDRSALRELFGRAGAGSPTESLWGHLDSEAAVYLDPYMDLEPDSLFVAEADGQLIGYLAGCVNTSSFPPESERMEQAFRRYRSIFLSRSALFFARAAVDTMTAKIRRTPSSEDFTDPHWPAHLHINIAPEGRGTGAADAMMELWFARLRSVDSPGCHLQTLVENGRAVKFFERMGFRAHGPEPLVPGVRYQGRKVRQRTMVREF
ncbi:GNAT family N-acetyltransferase [Nocardia cyriacigeorgica]|uniref:GNAT family N-acetyltransferase n=2 Tax=Nocardia cyriacigeorgica TaxID=135487 RepID=A0A6P1D957_9NOCA|nr:GNAT family N-acetyltransferase [Nocardia cyriacigeorgica]NEW45754.1 GNAT family N-acetyltransferase [Nocardia cyriacigeorgica]NEW51986.1 GNAT family N-acetyltransferase [Nocardia cyriacigeorgica]NEW55779.1 GNAT family N-acetyltransferase [Nocardia cyriacigeorgica]